MLTKQDLQAISKIIQSEIKTANKIQKDELKKEMVKRFNKIDNKFDRLIDMLEVENSQIRVRVSKVERHLKLSPSN